MADYIDHLNDRLQEIDKGIEQAKARLDSSGLPEKASALAELSQLRIRHDDLVQRIAAAKQKAPETWSSLRTSFQEEADALRDTVGTWLTKFG